MSTKSIYHLFVDKVSPIKLPSISDGSKTFAGILATASGFGKTFDSCKNSLFMLKGDCLVFFKL